MLLTRAFSEPRAPLKESHPIYFSSLASPGIDRNDLKKSKAYRTLDQSQDYCGHFKFIINIQYVLIIIATIMLISPDIVLSSLRFQVPCCIAFDV